MAESLPACPFSSAFGSSCLCRFLWDWVSPPLGSLDEGGDIEADDSSAGADIWASCVDLIIPCVPLGG